MQNIFVHVPCSIDNNLHKHVNMYCMEKTSADLYAKVCVQTCVMYNGSWMNLFVCFSAPSIFNFCKSAFALTWFR